MKKLSLIFSLVLGLFFCSSANAQGTVVASTTATATADYFPGKWNIVVKGTPNGDAKLTFVLQRVDGKLTGAVQDTTGKEMTKITSIDEKDKTITAAFTIQSYDVTLTLEPVDADDVKGSLMGMFDATGVRVKETH
ncbi:MAG TPA: hypothetical protein VFE53_00455 [Mucilaginibacter sp.]|jgi:hypothetical protein|nr:hypothetical protein [Mucilaginibacter sp.]